MLFLPAGVLATPLLPWLTWQWGVGVGRWEGAGRVRGSAGMAGVERNLAEGKEEG